MLISFKLNNKYYCVCKVLNHDSYCHELSSCKQGNCNYRLILKTIIVSLILILSPCENTYTIVLFTVILLYHRMVF